ncbi:tRNA glutamyl-Q(34) synthetase GluQRS [Rhizorhabdus dicambivorans]|uniref:tRNA glutamyl-Q(34) synthetase GluQRS n=2 Tax=Rhizorhabdus dicambivorans TaxID=1850238 RepID=A0A2A4FUM2_9SPHN|nr:tRNA glutamyl-Q(34) synthetase GluQRS [Rhizorhabdus dicambivorans]PCE41420.1 tRNA glutamyl-Q(34) synthetase GluQRS [Rhizorhabdus dicambivorans]
MSEMPISRFAPSPTGRLHLGHGFSALCAHDLARSAGGRFLLRIEDIDPIRCRPEHVAGIIEDLAWLGIGWDEPPLFQSQRLPLYADALGRLKAAGLVYPCFCTRARIAAEIAASAAAPHGPDGPLYPGICRDLPDEERAVRIAAGEAHAWRLDVAKAAALAGPLSWHDARAGEVAATPHAHGDVVLARKDAPTSYHLAVTVDDAAQGVTDVVRGEDLFAATHVHRLLQALLALPVPRYHHHALLADEKGERLAKRAGSPTLASMRAEGADPVELVARLRAAGRP